MGYNRFIGMGRMTRDVDLKSVGSGIEVVNFNVAVDRSIKSKDGGQDVDFIDCTAWRQTAAFIAKYFHKGDMIHFEGAFQSRKYDDKDGNKRTAWEVQVDHATFCGGKKSDTETTETPYQSFKNKIADIVDNAGGETVPNDDDLPF